VSGSRGQALVELALCVPFVLLLGVGATAVVEVADATSGLRAATDEAVAAAATAPDVASARAAAQSRFASVVAGYPVRSPSLRLMDGGFVRGAMLDAASTAYVDLGWAAIAVIPARVQISAAAGMRIDPWRTRP
jgi:Flp pilus assembly protein TadG